MRQTASTVLTSLRREWKKNLFMGVLGFAFTVLFIVVVAEDERDVTLWQIFSFFAVKLLALGLMVILGAYTKKWHAQGLLPAWVDTLTQEED